MKTSIPLLSFISTALASTYNPFTLPALTSHQPNGNPAGQVNYYRLAFSVNSPNSGSNASAYCNTFWGDNSWLQLEAYSVNVPTNQWFQCDSSEENLGDGESAFMFKLYPYFSIGNYSLAVKEDLGDGESVYGLTHITNTTEAYTCEINPQEVMYQQHAQGDCSIAEGKGPFEISVSTEEI